jgi:hypothetical protein
MIGRGLLAGKSQRETAVSNADTSPQADFWVVRALSMGSRGHEATGFASKKLVPKPNHKSDKYCVSGIVL